MGPMRTRRTSGALGERAGALAALRLLRAPLVALAMLLIAGSVLPGAAASTGEPICVAWSVIDGDDHDTTGGDCPFCSAAHVAVPPTEATPLAAMRPVAPAMRPARAPRAGRPRAPPLGPRAPPRS